MHRFLLRGRQIIAGFVLFSFILLFLAILPEKIQILLSTLTQFQFTSAFYAFLKLSGYGSVFFVILILSTILFGRWYCGFLCPLGILQDLVIRLKKLKVKRIKYSMFSTKWAYVTALLFSIGLLLAFSPFIHILEPYSNFGKFVNTLFKPLIIYPYNAFVSLLNALDIYSLYPYSLPNFSPIHFIIALILVGIPLIMAWFYGRRYCNLLCPVGGILRIVSKISLFKIQVNEDSCTHCGLCEIACKAEAIESSTMKINFDQCTHCYHCLNVCNSNSLEFSLWSNKNSTIESKETDSSKRHFLRKSFAILAGFTTFIQAQSKEIKVYVKNKIVVPRKHPILPPGSLNAANYEEYCIACQLCVSVCPTQVLKPSLKLNNINALLQPEMDFYSAFCNFNCTLCTDVCPTPAIISQSKEEKQLIQIGKSVFIKDNCVVYTQGTDCGACAEHCPTKAVRMLPDEKGILAPFIDDKICVGCGQCEYACPTIPHKAIYVEPNLIHIPAEKPKKEMPLELDKNMDDFPF